jgi:hypothetical protein
LDLLSAKIGGKGTPFTCPPHLGIFFLSSA